MEFLTWYLVYAVLQSLYLTHSAMKECPELKDEEFQFLLTWVFLAPIGTWFIIQDVCYAVGKAGGSELPSLADWIGTLVVISVLLSLFLFFTHAKADDGLLSTPSSTIGNQTFGPEGEAYTTIGSQTFESGGSIINRIDNSLYDNAGHTYTTIGNQTYDNEGHVYTRIDNTVYGPDGHYCTAVGMQTYCK